MNHNTDSLAASPLPDAAAYDRIEDCLQSTLRATIEAMFEEELAELLDRLRYGWGDDRAKGYPHGHRNRQLTGTLEHGGLPSHPELQKLPMMIQAVQVSCLRQDGQRVDRANARH